MWMEKDGDGFQCILILNPPFCCCSPATDKPNIEFERERRRPEAAARTRLSLLGEANCGRHWSRLCSPAIGPIAPPPSP